MRSDHFHSTDEELLLTADGELPADRVAEVRAHLAACWDCRARMAEIEGTIADFTRANHQSFDPQLTPIAGPRAMLRARLAQLSTEPAASPRRHFHFSLPVRMTVSFCGAFLVIALIGKVVLRHDISGPTNSSAVSPERGIEPNRTLTPGAMRQVSLNDVCSMRHEEVVREVPTPVRQEIFQEYGIANAQASDYEIDYLIAPGLGGTDAIQNLWPEPYASPVWNARVKDALEEHLHHMVCAGKVDLATAQKDIATDWIAAYKKYFHTDTPLSRPADELGVVEKGYTILAQAMILGRK
jgi:hypothetical protein